MKINQISLNGGYPTVKFSKMVTPDLSTDGTAPNKHTKNAAPLPSFSDAVFNLVEAIRTVNKAFAEFDWVLKSVRFLWNDELTEYGYEADVSTFWAEGSTALGLTIRQDSPDSVPPVVGKRLDELQQEAIKFATGKTAQLNLLTNENDIAEEEAA